MEEAETPIRPFESAAAWEEWLVENHPTGRAIWIQIAKKDSGIATVSYDEALDVALCYGWIDGQRKGYDETFFVQRFTPRRAKSLWSKRNVAKVEELIRSARMQPAGYAEIEAAQRDGRWEAAYDSQKDMEVPEDFVRAAEENEAAAATFRALNRSQRYGIAFRLHNAPSPEARARRFASLLGMLERGEAPR
jgi:uncharacterized protein YdeI (YjbR/CyaY-like superfamily)